MSHGHSHAHHGHSHSHDHDHHGAASETRVLWAAALTGLFMIAEVAGGLISGSLALLADAGHMFVDFAGLMLAFLAFRIARRPADARNTFGYDRFQILVAYSNGLVLFAIAGIISFEAWERLQSPAPVLAGPMLAVAVAGLVVNIAAFAILHGGDKEDLNLQGALLHVTGDLLGSLAAIAAALVILWTGWTPIDPILSVLVCLLILVNAWRLVRESGRILLEGAPTGLDTATIAPRLVEAVPGLSEVHHVHVWAITPKRRAATLHACIAEGLDGTAVVRAVKAEMATRFAVSHTTVEIEHGVCADGRPVAAHDDHHHGHHHDHDHDHAQDHGHRHDDHAHAGRGPLGAAGLKGACA